MGGALCVAAATGTLGDYAFTAGPGCNGGGGNCTCTIVCNYVCP
jgi:hypothetical protein